MQQLRQGLPLALLICGVVFVLGIVGFFLWAWINQTVELGPVGPSRQVTEQAEVSDVERWLAEARVAVNQDNLVQPVGNSALELYLKVLEADSENNIAKVALIELLPDATPPAERLIEGQQFDEAERVIKMLETADPGSLVISALGQKLDVARRGADQARVAEQERARQQVLAAQQAAQGGNAAAATTAAPRAPIGEATDADINPLSSNPANRPAATPASDAATAGNQPAATPTAATPPPTQAAATPPPSTAAATAPQTRKFELIKSVQPEYPQRALRQRIEGWVEIEFTVNTNGDVENVKVLNANPRRGEFDREAIRAVQQWKFRPQISDGRPVAATARQRLNFTLN